MVITEEAYPYRIVVHGENLDITIRKSMWQWCRESFGDYKVNKRWTWSNDPSHLGEFKFRSRADAEWFILKWS